MASTPVVGVGSATGAVPSPAGPTIGPKRRPRPVSPERALVSVLEVVPGLPAEVADLKVGLAYMHQHCEAVGRETPPEIVMASINQVGEVLSPQQMIDRIGEFAELGVTTVATNFHVDSRAEWIEKALRFDEEIIKKVS